jgi:hypothetical protein
MENQQISIVQLTYLWVFEYYKIGKSIRVVELKFKNQKFNIVFRLNWYYSLIITIYYWNKYQIDDGIIFYSTKKLLGI